MRSSPKLAPTHVGVAVIIGVAFALLPLSTDFYLASLPGLRRHFDVSVSQVQLTLSVFIAAFALAQLVYGPLTDRFGRRPMLLAGITIYAIASIGCMTAQSIEWLLAARFFQALGACSGQVIGRAIIRDVYGGASAARMFGFITAGTACAPVLGPMLGSVLTVAFGWRATFAAVALIGVALLVTVWRWLGETNAHPDPRATDVRQLARNYAFILRDRRFIGYALCVGLSYGGVFAWISGSSFVLIEVMGVPTGWFGVLFGFAVLPYIISNVLTGKLVMRVGAQRILNAGTLIAASAGTLLLAFALAGVQSLPALLLPVTLFLFSMGFNLPCAMAGAIGPFPRLAGTASALLGFVQMSCGAITGFAVGRLHDGTTVPVAATICLLTWLLLASFHLLVRRPGRAAGAVEGVD